MMATPKINDAVKFIVCVSNREGLFSCVRHLINRPTQLHDCVLCIIQDHCRLNFSRVLRLADFEDNQCQHYVAIFCMCCGRLLDY